MQYEAFIFPGRLALHLPDFANGFSWENLKPFAASTTAFAPEATAAPAATPAPTTAPPTAAPVLPILRVALFTARPVFFAPLFTVRRALSVVFFTARPVFFAAPLILFFALRRAFFV